MLKAQHADAMIMVLASYEWVAVLIIIVVIALAYLLWRSFSQNGRYTKTTDDHWCRMEQSHTE